MSYTHVNTVLLYLDDIDIIPRIYLDDIDIIQNVV